MRCLGLDIGDKRTGVALSDPLGILASPLLVFDHRDDEADIAAILEMVKRYEVQYIIVGLPQSMDGSLGSQAEKVKLFTDKLRLLSPVPVESRDERLTTVTAKRLMQESGSRKTLKNIKFRKGEYDAAAAAVILQSYLNEARPLEYPPDAP
jgi:putative holliday junction resolvase